MIEGGNIPVVFYSKESNGPTDCYAAISQADRLQVEPESLRKWREEQQERLEVLGKNGAILAGAPDFSWVSYTRTE